MSVTSDNKLKHYCKNCGFNKISDEGTAVQVSETRLSQDNASYEQFMTKYIKFDKTLPRVNNVVCTNPKCTAHENEVIYIKYDQTNMLYLYYCCHCEHFWRN
jgi:hypothetical protein